MLQRSLASSQLVEDLENTALIIKIIKLMPSKYFKFVLIKMLVRQNFRELYK